MHLDVQMVEHTIDPSAVKTKDTIESVEFKIQHLISQMQFISKQQDFERVRMEGTKEGDATLHSKNFNCDVLNFFYFFLC